MPRIPNHYLSSSYAVSVVTDPLSKVLGAGSTAVRTPAPCGRLGQHSLRFCTLFAGHSLPMSSCDGYREVYLHVETGPIGINLQSVRGGRGAFVESFYRADDGHLYDAEGCGQIWIGDRIAFIANNKVLTDSIDIIHSKLQQQHRPFMIRLHRSECFFEVVDLVFDPRVKVWINTYMEDYCIVSDGYLLRRKADVYFLSKLLCDFLTKYRVDGADGGESAGDLRALCNECLQFCIDDNADDQQVLEIKSLAYPIIDAHSNVQYLSRALKYLHKDLSKALLVKFQQCSIARKLAGWMSDSPPFRVHTIVQILEQQELAVCYYLHLCTLGMHRQRYLHLLLNKQQRLRPRGACTSPYNSKLHSIMQRIVLQAAREGLLYSFYGSTIYELLLRERENSEMISSWLIQRALRAVTLPVGISLHRRGNPGAHSLSSLTPPADTEPGHILLFDSSAPSSVHVTASAALIVEDGGLIGCPASASVLAAPVLQFLVPCGPCLASIGSEQSPPESKLVNFTISMKGGITLYGASFVTYRRVQKPACSPSPLVESNFSADDAAFQFPQPPVSFDLEPNSAAEDVVNAAVQTSSTPDAASSSNAAIGDPSPGSLLNKRSASQESLLNLMLTKGQEGALQSALVMAKVRIGAGDVIRGIKLWSEHAALPSIHLPSLVAQASAQSQTPTATATQSIVQAEFPDAADRIASPRSNRADQDGDGHYLAHGVSILTAEPKVDCLRHLLRLAARHLLPTHAAAGAHMATEANSEETQVQDGETLQSILSDWSAARDLMKGLCTPAVHQGVATDFNASAVFEALCPHNLVTLFIAILLEYRVVLVSSGHTVALLVCEWLKLAILPLKWCHIYAPVVPEHVSLQLLQCPAPYLLGVRRESLKASPAPPPADVLLVDLDGDTVTVPADLRTSLAAAATLVHQLAAFLKPNLSSCDYVVQGDVHEVSGGTLSDPLCVGGPAELCQQYVHTLLKPLEKCIVILDEAAETTVALDEELLVRKVCAAAAPSTSSVVLESLIRQMMRAQSFSEHLLSVAANFKNKTQSD